MRPGSAGGPAAAGGNQRVRLWWRALAALALLVLTAVPASASEESQALAARGLIELNAGRTQEALALFDRAVAADPSDADVRYQRGATRAKLGDYQGAIGDLQAVLAVKPDLAPAALELGAALTETGRYAEAERWLLQAQQQPDLDAQASFFLGLAQLRLGRLDGAEQNFARARERDPSLALASEYYQGIIAYRKQDFDSAEARFAAVERANSDSAMGRESARFLALIQRAPGVVYSAFGSVSFEYDSNVTLGPADTIAGGITGEADGRAVLNVGGRYVPWRRGHFSLALSYEFFQSLQFRLTEFNLQDNRPAVQLMFDYNPITIGVLGRYDYYLLGSESFLSEATAFPWASVREEKIGHTDLYYRMQFRDYKNANPFSEPPPTPGAPPNPGFRVLNGFYNFVGIRQIVELGAPDREIWVGYQLGFTTPEGQGSDEFQYGSNQFEVALRWPLPYSILSEAGYRYEHQDYAGASEVFSPNKDTPRRDNDHRVVVAFERPLSEIYEHLFVNAAWFGTFNNSNQSVFEYDRQIGSIGAEVRF
jgi:tetratricopeptide (TPR) repeat protein